MRKSGISWRKSHSFYTTRGIPLKDRRSIDILRAHEKRNCILSRASTAWSSRQYSLEVTPQPQASFTKLHGQWPIANGKKGTSFRESAPFPAWKHLEADPWGPPPGDTPGNTVMAGAPSHWLKKRSAQIQKLWLYSGDTKVFVIFCH